MYDNLADHASRLRSGLPPRGGLDLLDLSLTPLWATAAASANWSIDLRRMTFMLSDATCPDTARDTHTLCRTASPSDTPDISLIGQRTASAHSQGFIVDLW